MNTKIIVISILGFIFLIGLLGFIYYFYFDPERVNLKKYIQCMCKNYKENKEMNENEIKEAGKKCFSQLDDDVKSHYTFELRSRERYSGLWIELEECKKNRNLN